MPIIAIGATRISDSELVFASNAILPVTTENWDTRQAAFYSACSPSKTSRFCNCNEYDVDVITKARELCQAIYPSIPIGTIVSFNEIGTLFDEVDEEGTRNLSIPLDVPSQTEIFGIPCFFG